MDDGVGIWISGHKYNARFLDLIRHGLIMCEFARFLDFRLRDVKSLPAFGGSSGGCSCIRDLMYIFPMELNCRHFLCLWDTEPHWVRGPTCILYAPNIWHTYWRKP
jgi:hypothetical protein